MIKIGHRKILYRETVFIPQNEEAEFTIEITKTDIFVLVFRFEHDEKSEEKASMRVLPEGSRGVMTFKNWTSSLGSAITTPFSLATSNENENITFLGNIVKIGLMYKVEFQLMIEEAISE